MLALAMASSCRPQVLLIDELSLGLAPVIVGQLLPIVERLADDGVAVVLVEQSVNVALTVAERAYFMERGAIRFSGPTAELLDRPDLLRSVFLAGGDERRRRAHVAASAASPMPRPARPTTRPSLAVAGLSRHLRRHPRRRRRLVRRSARGEIVGIIGPNGAGKTTMFDLISGFTPLDAGAIMLAGHDVTSLGAAGRAARRARPHLPGRPAVPRHDRERDAGDLARAIRRAAAACSPPRCASRRVYDSETHVARAGRRAARAA